MKSPWLLMLAWEAIPICFLHFAVPAGANQVGTIYKSCPSFPRMISLFSSLPI